ncbi:hypothetical protein Tco_1450661 [Tanacetum coccineum]
MVESSSHNPSSSKITPKEEPVTFDKLESPNPFLPADQIELSFDDIAFTTNNEVALLYPSHPNSEYFREVELEETYVSPLLGMLVIVGRLGEREEATDGSDPSVFMWENKWHGSNIKQACHHLILSGK